MSLTTEQLQRMTDGVYLSLADAQGDVRTLVAEVRRLRAREGFARRLIEDARRADDDAAEWEWGAQHTGACPCEWCIAADRWERDHG